MQLPSLRQHALFGAFTLAFASLGPADAHAQDGDIDLVVESFGGRDAPVLLSGTAGRPISAEECETNVEIPLQLPNVPYDGTETRYLDVWRGTPTSGACQTATNRQPTAGGEPICTFVGSFQIDSTMMDVALGAMTAFESCDLATTQQYWFLNVLTMRDNSTNVDAANYGTLLIGLDPTPPADPTGLEPSAGDTQISISWNNPDGVELLSAANIYVDPDGCDESGNVIAGGTLTEGGTPPGDPQQTANGASVSTATIDGSAIGIEYGEYAAIAVSIVDLGNNESNLSNVVCIQRVEVLGFWDAYCADRGIEDDDECREQYGCAASGPRGGRGTFAGLALVLGAILLVSRRRSRRSAR